MPNTFLDRAAQTANTLRGLLPDPAKPRPTGRYDRLIDVLNRLPRPVLVYGTVALLFLALLKPDLFDRAMTSLQRMPEELWWLIGAILAGHFGAREAYHLRNRPSASQMSAEPPTAEEIKAPANSD